MRMNKSQSTIVLFCFLLGATQCMERELSPKELYQDLKKTLEKYKRRRHV